MPMKLAIMKGQWWWWWWWWWWWTWSWGGGGGGGWRRRQCNLYIHCSQSLRTKPWLWPPLARFNVAACYFHSFTESSTPLSHKKSYACCFSFLKEWTNPLYLTHPKKSMKLSKKAKIDFQISAFPLVKLGASSVSIPKVSWKTGSGPFSSPKTSGFPTVFSAKSWKWMSRDGSGWING